MIRALGRAAKVALVAIVIGEWYSRGGREFLFGAGEDEQLPEGLRRIKNTMVVSPPSAAHTFTELSAKRFVGDRVTAPDGTDVGEVLAAERIGEGWMRVMYDVDREVLGFPVSVAVAQAESYVAAAARRVAVKL